MDLRIKNIYAKLEQENLDGLIVSSPFNISYLTQFTSRDAYLVISPKENVYITDSRYFEAVKKSLLGCKLKKINGSVFKVIANVCRELRFKRVGFEERHLIFGEHKKIKEGLNKKIDLISTSGLIEGLRQIKSQLELEKIKKAVQITVMAFRFIQGFLSPGKKEIEIAAELERFIRYNGANASSFEIIVASGPNSAFPHHLTSQRRIRNHEPVLIDLGVEYLGYKSDLTRVLFLGKITSEFRRIYQIVLQAQNRALKSIKPAVPVKQIDRVARQYITQKGFGGFFGHNLGHGIGLEVHEDPQISGKESALLIKGMVFTVEPGIYLPGKFGVRLEDMVLVTDKGVELLSGSLHK